jgi:nucleoside-diphosphate-sugar epimerase
MSLTHKNPSATPPARAVVLGSGGFLGRRLIKDLTEAAIPVLGLGTRDLDLTDPAAGAELKRRLQPGDAVVFLSALTPDKGRNSATLMKNLAMARAVIDAVQGLDIAQLVYASSDAVYSFADPLISEATPSVPTDLYGTMHRTREIMLGSEVKTPLALVRLTAIYGAGDTHNSYGPNRFIRQALKDGRISLGGDGEETRDHVYVADAGALIKAIVMHGSVGLLNIASGRSVSFRNTAESIAGIAGRSVAIEPSPRQNPITHRSFDTVNLIRAFPNFRFTPMKEGLAATLAGMAEKADG